MQKYLLDENLSRKLAGKLIHIYVNITHVSDEGLLNCDDAAIWKFAKNNGFTIITKDYDFYDMSHLFGCPPKVIKLNCGNKTTDYISESLLKKQELINFFAESSNCYMEIF